MNTIHLMLVALPTQINPTERGRFLDTLMTDLDPRQDATWTSWPDDSESVFKLVS